MLGTLTVSVFRHERVWPEDLVLGFKLIGQIIANALLRKQSQMILQAEIEQRIQHQQEKDRVLSIAMPLSWKPPIWDSGSKI